MKRILNLFPNHAILINCFKKTKLENNETKNLLDLTIKTPSCIFYWRAITKEDSIIDLYSMRFDETYVHGPGHLWNPDLLFKVFRDGRFHFARGLFFAV